jgi:L-cysteine S-thiosulfotransferase
LSGRCIVLLSGLMIAAGAVAQALAPYRVDGDAIEAPIAGARGDAAKGREVVLGRESNCLLCHTVPDAGGRPMGDIAPPLAGVGARFSAGQLRLRIVDSSRTNPQTPMPAYYRVDGLNGVAAAFRGKPILSAQEVEDVVAYLVTLK